MAEPKSNEERQTHHLYMIERLITDYHKQSLHHLHQMEANSKDYHKQSLHHLYQMEANSKAMLGAVTELLDQVRAARGLPKDTRKRYQPPKSPEAAGRDPFPSPFTR